MKSESQPDGLSWFVPASSADIDFREGDIHVNIADSWTITGAEELKTAPRNADCGRIRYISSSPSATLSCDQFLGVLRAILSHVDRVRWRINWIIEEGRLELSELQDPEEKPFPIAISFVDIIVHLCQCLVELFRGQEKTVFNMLDKASAKRNSESQFVDVLFNVSDRDGSLTLEPYPTASDPTAETDNWIDMGLSVRRDGEEIVHKLQIEGALIADDDLPETAAEYLEGLQERREEAEDEEDDISPKEARNYIPLPVIIALLHETDRLNGLEDGK